METWHFGSLALPDAVGKREVAMVRLQSAALRVTVIGYGATLHAVEAPDRHGHHEDVCLSLQTLSEHEDRSRNPYLGATCGRYAGRIAAARFELDGRSVDLEPNDGPNHLHGGPDGFATRVWDLAEAVDNGDGGRASFVLTSPAGDQGHPGTMVAVASYELHGHQLRIAYEATSDAPTVVNLCNHAYWNLGGREAWQLDRSVADHELRLPASAVVPSDDDQLPSGPAAPLEGTPFDLRHAPLLDDVFARLPRGLDHSYPVPREPLLTDDPEGLHLAAELHHPRSGRTLTITTDQPSVHVYTANALGPPFARQAAVCLETQRYPDAPNQPELGPAVLRPGETYRSTTELTFGLR